MTDKKYCLICGKLISDINDPTCNYYRHIKIRYCSYCKETMRTIQNRQNQRQYRQNNKAINKLKNDRIQLLQEENAILRQRLASLMTEGNYHE